MDSATEVVWKESFFKDDFNVDNCLAKYTVKSDLESLRYDLKNFGNDLHQQMSEILKSETEAIVNLAEYLTNLSSNIDDLSIPISQLREEIKTLYDLLKKSAENYSHSLESTKENNTRHNYLTLKLGIATSALYISQMLHTNDNDLFNDSIILERVVNKFSFEYNNLQAFGVLTDSEDITLVGKKLTELVNKVFLKSITNNDEQVILRALRMYENLGEQKQAEKTYQVFIIRPEIKHLFNEHYLENCNQNIDDIYEECLNTTQPHLNILNNVLKTNEELKSFNFYLNSFWIEVDKELRDGLPLITAPGNPELFQKRFKSTWNFLKIIAEKCGDENLIFFNETFQNHIRRFSLPVYFEIRFQQLAAMLETQAIIKIDKQMNEENNEINCCLNITLTLWKAIQMCFSEEVFIDNLCDQFLKLFMLLLARYLKWFEVALKDYQLFPDIWESFITKATSDLNLINTFIGEKSDGFNIINVIPNSIKPILFKNFELNSKLINNIISKLRKNLIDIKSNDSLTFLQNVAAIPRLYRRTNRNAPKEPSNYVVEALQPVLKFNEKFGNLQYNNDIQIIIDSVIANTTKQYQSLVEEVLHSVCKTEESLRRLKNRSSQMTESVGEEVESFETMSDEKKIREQIKLDVNFFVEKFYPLAMDHSKKLMDDLKNQTG